MTTEQNDESCAKLGLPSLPNADVPSANDDKPSKRKSAQSENASASPTNESDSSERQPSTLEPARLSGFQSPMTMKQLGEALIAGPNEEGQTMGYRLLARAKRGNPILLLMDP